MSWGLAEPLEAIAVLELSGLDVERLLDEDELASIAGGPLRFAVSRSTQLSPRDHGTWESLPGGLQLWRLRVRAPGATSLGLAFERFALPPGARLDLYSSDRSQRIRAFDHRDNTELGELWTPALPTDDLIIELTLPAHSSENWQLTSERSTKATEISTRRRRASPELAMSMSSARKPMLGATKFAPWHAI